MRELPGRVSESFLDLVILMEFKISAGEALREEKNRTLWSPIVNFAIPNTLKG